MSIRDRLAKYSISVARTLSPTLTKRLFGIGSEDDFFSFQEKYGSGAKAKAQLDSYKGTVYACVSVIAERVGMYQPRLYRVKNEEEVEVTEHELIELIKNPQPGEAAGISGFDLMEATQSFIELAGECFWYVLRTGGGNNPSGRPVGLYIIRPDKMGISIDKNGDVEGYFVRRPGKPNIPFSVDEILHFKMFNPKDPYHGRSTIASSQDFVDTEEYTTRFVKNFFKNNAGLSGTLSLKGEVASGAFKKFVRKWREKYEGVDNAGKVAILRETDASFTKVGLGLDEMDMKALRDMTKEDIFMAFRVPKALVGISDKEGLGRASVETHEYIFAKYAIEPRFMRIDAVLQLALKRYWGDRTITVGHKNDIPADKDYELKQRELGVDKWLTRNEIRQMEGRPPVEGGDELYVPISSFPIGDDNPTTTDKKAKITIRRTIKEDEDYTRKENFRLSLIRLQQRYEKKFKSATDKLLDEQKDQVIGNLSPKSASTKDIQLDLFDTDDANDKFVDKLVPVTQSLANDAGPLALLLAGDEDNKFKLNEALKTKLSRSLERMANRFNVQTKEALIKTLEDGIAAGESLSKLTKRVSAVYKDAKGYRATRIAQTETLKASNGATVQAYKQVGYVTKMKWFANPGHCPLCASLNGKEVGLEDNFASLGEEIEGTDGETTQTIDYEDVEHPPLHPNCKCTIVPVIE